MVRVSNCYPESKLKLGFGWVHYLQHLVHCVLIENHRTTRCKQEELKDLRFQQCNVQHYTYTY